MTKKTKAELLDEISELTAQLEEAKRAAADDLACVVQANIEEQAVLEDAINGFLDRARPHYPEICSALDDAIEGAHYWIDEPPTGFIIATIPRAAVRVRWNFASKELEFEYPNISGFGTHWSTPLPGEFTEQL